MVKVKQFRVSDEWSKTHCIYIELMWEPFHVWVWGYNQCTMTSFAASLWPAKFVKFLYSVPTSMVVVAWCWIHLPPTPYESTPYEWSKLYFLMQCHQVWWKWHDVGYICPPLHMNPLLMNGLKHIVYVSSGWGNHSMWVWCLNQCTMTSFAASLWPVKFATFLNAAPTSMVLVA
jgi:hypothetical protein